MANNMKLLIVCPIPIEFNACRSVFALKDIRTKTRCRAARGIMENTEVYIIESGPAKARSAAETVAGINQFDPDLVIDTGTCGGLSSGSLIGEIIISEVCYEYDISGSGFPRRIIPEMKLPSAFEFLSINDKDRILRKAAEFGRDMNYFVKSGIQASGEYLVQSLAAKKNLHSLLHADACNWETAGVFIASLKNSVPPLSIRIVSDLGDEDALKTFRKNAKKSSFELYRFIENLIVSGWFSDFMESWKLVSSTKKESMPDAVLP